MKVLQGIGLLSVVAVLSLALSDQAAADPAVTVRTPSGAICTADYIFLKGKEHAPFFIFTYQGAGGPATVIFRLTSFGSYPAVYVERAILGTGAATIFQPFGPRPVVVFGPAAELEVTEEGRLVPTGNLSLFAPGADMLQVLRVAATDFCNGFTPAALTSTETAATTAAATPTPGAR
jgi:hypothetical protein